MLAAMRSVVVIRNPQGGIAELGHGDLIGRLGRAELRIDDPRVSEAHAMVSLRAETLKLVALRGRLKVEGRPVSEVVLAVGQVIELASGVELRIEDVVTPEEVLGLEGEGLPRQPLHGVVSLFTLPRPRLEPGFHAQADATFWGEEASWRVAVGGQPARDFAAGDRFQIGDLAFRAVLLPLAQAASSPTVSAAAPVRIVASYDTAQIHQGGVVCMLAGVPARLLSELVAFKGPAAWEVLAQEIWGAAAERDALRTRFDMALSRLRKRFRDSGVRGDLVVMSGTGQIELVLRDGDVVEDCM
jgi:hypothetical protein